MSPSCDLYVPRGGTIHTYIYIYINNAGTFSQEHCGIFVGRWLQCSPAAPCSNKKLYIYSDGTHTHTHTHRYPAIRIILARWWWNHHKYCWENCKNPGQIFGRVAVQKRVKDFIFRRFFTKILFHLPIVGSQHWGPARRLRERFQKRFRRSRC